MSNHYFIRLKAAYTMLNLSRCFIRRLCISSRSSNTTTDVPTSDWSGDKSISEDNSRPQKITIDKFSEVNKECNELVETLLNSPLLLEEWKGQPKNNLKNLSILQQHVDPLQLPSVSKVMSDTKSSLNELILSRWKKKMKHELGEEGFQEHMIKIRTSGLNLHELIEKFLQGEKITEEDSESGLWKSISPVLTQVSDVHCIEKEVFHPVLCYMGRLDCVGVFKNHLCVFDWKTSSKKRDTLSKCYDDPYQVAAYAGSFNITSTPEFQVKNAVIVKVYNDGSPADVHCLNEFSLNFFWNAWLRRLAQYHCNLIYEKMK